MTSIQMWSVHSVVSGEAHWNLHSDSAQAAKRAILKSFRRATPGNWDESGPTEIQLTSPTEREPEDFENHTIDECNRINAEAEPQTYHNFFTRMYLVGEQVLEFYRSIADSGLLFHPVVLRCGERRFTKFAFMFAQKLTMASEITESMDFFCYGEGKDWVNFYSRRLADRLQSVLPGVKFETDLQITDTEIVRTLNLPSGPQTNRVARS